MVAEDAVFIREILSTLISKPSVSGTEEEKQFGYFLRDLVVSFPWWTGVEEWVDEQGRVSILGYRKGHTSTCLLFLGHYDTVDVTDYPEREIAFSPKKAAEWLSVKRHFPEELKAKLREGWWMAGRGSLDMKAGIVAQFSLMQNFTPPGDVPLIFLWVPDEERDSAGARFCFPRLWQFLKERSLTLKWVILSDFTHQKGAIYTGSTGKCLLNAYVRTSTGHISEGSDQPNAVSLASHLVSVLPKVAPPFYSFIPLYMQSLSSGYSVQNPFECWAYFNTLNPSWTVGGLNRSWIEKLEGKMMGKAEVKWAETGEKIPHGENLREKALSEVRKRYQQAGVWLFLSPPFYPAVSTPKTSPMYRIMKKAIRWAKRNFEEHFHLQSVYPYISDISFFQKLDSEWEIFQRHCPVEWGPVWEGKLPALTVLGPYGYGAHSPEECVDVKYAVQILPQMYRYLIDAGLMEGLL